MESRETLFTVGPGPHWRSKTSVTQMNYAFILALLPAAAIGVIAHGFMTDEMHVLGRATGLEWLLGSIVREFGISPGLLASIGAGGVLAMGMGVGVAAEYLIQVLFRQPYHAMNGHGALMGLLVAMFMPVSVPWWTLVIGVFLAILIGKQLYGGIGSYPFHPAMVGWLILLLSWPHHIYPVGMKSIASAHFAVILTTAAGGIALCALGHIRWQIPAAVIGGVILGSLIFGSVAPEKLGGGSLAEIMAAQFISGHVIIAAFFLATDSTSSPTNNLPAWLFGICMGLLIMLIRTYGQWPDAIPFAVLLSNVLNPLLDRIRPKVTEVVIQNG